MQTFCLKHRGLSLVEVVISTLVVGVMLVAALDALGAVFRSQRLNAARLTGPGLARELMGEILSLPYEDPESPGGSLGRESGESGGDRADFDDVDDYNSWNDDPQTKDGVEYPDYTDWEQKVAVNWVSPANLDTFLSGDQGLKKITVVVTDPDGKTTTLVALRSNLGSLEQLPAVDTTGITWMGAQLELGGASPVYSGTQLSNQVYDSN
jgi:MSHA pilin protein MshD